MSEHDEQVAFFQWFRHAYPHVPAFAIPNAGKRSYRVGQMMKAEGLAAGVPDILIADGRPGCFIELKIKGNKPTDNQREWLSKLSKSGYHTAVCYGFDEAKTCAEFYLRAR